MAYTYDVGVQCHACGSPLANVAALQLEAVIPNFVIHEHHVGNTLPGITCLGKYNYQPKDGYFEVPDLPGFGQDLSDYAIQTATGETIR